MGPSVYKQPSPPSVPKGGGAGGEFPRSVVGTLNTRGNFASPAIRRYPRGVFYEPKERRAKVRKEHRRDEQEVQGIHGRGTSRDEGVRPRDEGVRTARPAPGEGGWGKRFAHEDRGDAGTGSRDGQAAPCDHQGQCASPLAENLVRDARVCQGRRGRLLLPARAEVQNEVRDPRLQRRGEPRRRRPVAGRLRAEGVDPDRRGKDQRAREESHPLRTETYRRSIATNESGGGFIVAS